MIAALQDFGAPSVGIPPRPFFRNMVKEKSPGWADAIAVLLKANNYDAEKTLDMAGLAIEGQLRESIITTNEPPLSEVTLMLRKWKKDHPDSHVTKRIVWEMIGKVKAGETSSLGGTAAKPLIETSHLLNSVDHEVK